MTTHGSPTPSALAVLTVVGAILLAGCTQPAPGSGLMEDFEAGLAAWSTGADVPDDPNDPGSKVDWSITVGSARARSGVQSVNLTIDGRQDDGTIWIVRSLPVEPGTRYRADVTAHAWSEAESFNTIAHLVMLLSAEPPVDEASFPSTGEHEPRDEDAAPGRGLREPLDQAAGWKEYAFEWTTPPLEAETLHLAVGITVVWEIRMSRFVDDVEVRLEPV